MTSLCDVTHPRVVGRIKMATHSQGPAKKWKKILYEKQDYPDNYVDPEQFLKELKNNLYTQTYTLQEIVIASSAVTQEMSSVFVFIGVFWYLEAGMLTAPQLLVMCLVMSMLLVLLWVLLLFLTNHTSAGLLDLLSQWSQPVVLFLLFLCGTSPILKTLTESVSTDTIWAMTVAMLGAHLLCHCYDGDKDMMTTGAVSLNAAIFAAVCLASRLPTALHAFDTVLFAVLLFAILPHLRIMLQNNSRPISSALTFLVVMPATMFILLPVSTHSLLLYLISVLSVSLICPVWFTRLQQLKNTIHGPWDEAAINVHES